ncbi:MAG: hypothetical protein PVH87_27010 [Desulfobacteraceae bacterium]|jgi:hypothetical protein
MTGILDLEFSGARQKPEGFRAKATKGEAVVPLLRTLGNTGSGADGSKAKAGGLQSQGDQG